MLLLSAKVSQLASLPQCRAKVTHHVCVMTEAMLNEGFSNCGNHYECQAACPKGIKASFIAKLNRKFLKAQLK